MALLLPLSVYTVIHPFASKSLCCECYHMTDHFSRWFTKDYILLYTNAKLRHYTSQAGKSIMLYIMLPYLMYLFYLSSIELDLYNF